MKHSIVSFGAGPYAGSVLRLGREALASGLFGGIHLSGPESLGPDFWRDGMTHERALRTRRGYWFIRWKPRAILGALEQADEGDTVMWVDAGCTINPAGRERMEEYREIVRSHHSGVLAFQLDFPAEGAYTADHVIADLRPRDEDLLTGQIIATTILFRVCRSARELLGAWKGALEERGLAEEVPCARPGFIEHRHDQSVFSLLCKARGAAVLPDETWAPDFSAPEMLRYPIWATRLASDA